MCTRIQGDLKSSNLARVINAEREGGCSQQALLWKWLQQLLLHDADWKTNKQRRQLLQTKNHGLTTFGFFRWIRSSWTSVNFGTSLADNDWCCGQWVADLSVTERKGIMRDGFLHTCAISGSTNVRESAWPGLDITDPVVVGFNMTELSGITGTIDLPTRIRATGCSGCSVPSNGRSTTGISDYGTDGIDNLLPSSWPTLYHCKRPSLKNRREMICCLLVERRGRYRCPKFCD